MQFSFFFSLLVEKSAKKRLPRGQVIRLFACLFQISLPASWEGHNFYTLYHHHVFPHGEIVTWGTPAYISGEGVRDVEGFNYLKF